MFICSECGTKYEIMPKFCDCGNDIFIEEEPQKPEPQIEEIPQKQTTRKKGRGKVESFSPAAIGTFAFCLILSLVILFFIGNPKKEDLSQEPAKEDQIEQPVNIPAIDSFWDNTVAKTEQKEEIKEEPQEKPVINIVPKFVQNILPPETKKTQAPKTNKTTVSKPVSVQKTQTAQKTTPKSQQQTTPQTNQQAQAVTNRVKNNIQYNTKTNTQNTTTHQPVQTTNPQPVQITKTPPTTQITQPQTTVVNKNPAPVTTSTATTASKATTSAPVIKTKTQTELTKELNTYKASLRNTIGRKIDFTKVIGDGDCALSFKINSSGRLISKAFTKQSSNITLNDAVFSAMNSTTSFNPPPEGYKGEALTLKIRFYNGNFEITLN